ncbi:MAG TPA: class I SAM-dependent methyltransferase [Gaiellaceae bacterium]|nr:class I SAM-dependent methyltransferase [Gaiellaceae bacterium]
MPDSEPEPFDPQTYWAERLSAAYSLEGVGWYGLGEEFNRWMYAVRRHAFRRAVTGRVAGATRVLDVGTGTGFYIDCWRELGVRDIVGSDLTSVAVERLRDSYPAVEFFQFDLTASTLPDLGTFDAISAMDVMFHIVDDDGYRRAVNNLATLLKPGGFLVLTENFLHAGSGRGRHEVDRTISEIDAMLHEVNLDLIYRRPVFVLMNTPIDSQSGLLQRTWTGINLLVRRGPLLAKVVGGLTYPLELALTRVVREGPSTEIAVCEKR